MADVRGSRKCSRRNVTKPGVEKLNRIKRLGAEFFDRDPRRVSRDLLGKLLVRRQGGKRLIGRIVEVEAYLGTGDLAAHAAAGRTARNEVLFGPPGHAYVYFIYGNHYCLNISCLRDGVPGCVLIRALEPVGDINEMARARGVSVQRERDLRMLTSGPGRLAQAFGITRERDNGKNLTNSASDLFVAEDGFHPRRVSITKRVGITKAAQMPLRYVMAGNEFVTRAHLSRG